MRYIIAAIALLLATSAFALGESGKIEVCRHPTIIAQADKSKVEIQEPIFFKLSSENYNGDTDIWIEVSNQLTLGPKPSCVVADGKVTRNTKGGSLPKKGDTWKAEARAKPGQHWGQKPVVKTVRVGNASATVEESDPSKGGPIQSVTLRGRVLEDFK